LRVAVIGSSGGMGSYFVKYFLSRGYDVVGSDVVTPRNRPRRFAFCSSNVEATKGSDVVLVASPIDTTISVANECVRSMRRGSVLVEISSVKGKILPQLRRLTSRKGVTLLSIHPLFGPSLRSRRGMKLMVVSDGRSDGLELSRKFFPDAEILPVGGREHDKLVALTLALTHLVNILYAKTMSSRVRPEQLRKLLPPMSTVQLALAEGVLSQDPRLYSYILTENEETRHVVRTLSRNVNEVLRIVERGDRRAFERLYTGLAKAYSDDARKNRSLSMIYKAFETD